MENQLLSLYDYLGKAAGIELGKKVNEAAKKAGIPQSTREVSNPKYTGRVFTYPKDFLDAFFTPQHPDDVPNTINDDLPF